MQNDLSILDHVAAHVNRRIGMNNHFDRGTGRLAVSPAEAARMLGLGRTKFYELLSTNEITSVKIGTRRLIRVAELEAWLAAQDVASET